MAMHTMQIMILDIVDCRLCWIFLSKIQQSWKF